VFPDADVVFAVRTMHVALECLCAANGLLIRSAGIPHMDGGSGVVTGRSVDWLLRRIDSLLA
jgi:hypothetical protein